MYNVVQGLGSIVAQKIVNIAININPFFSISLSFFLSDSIRLSLSLSVSHFLLLSLFLSLLPFSLSLCLYVSLCFCLSLFIYRSINLCSYLSINLSECVSLTLCESLCLSLFLFNDHHAPFRNTKKPNNRVFTFLLSHQLSVSKKYVAASTQNASLKIYKGGSKASRNLSKLKNERMNDCFSQLFIHILQRLYSIKLLLEFFMCGNFK